VSILDAIIVIVVLLFLSRGIWVGFIKQIASIAALLIGFIVSGRYYGESANLIIPFIDNKQVGFFITYVFLFSLSFFSVIVLGILLKKVITISLLGWFDRFLGGFLGLAKGVFVSCLILMGLSLFISGASPIFRQSYVYPYLENSSRFVLSVIKDKNLRESLLPQNPAISTFLNDTIELGQPINGKAK
jgi:membrane protein required for colicin V production